MKKEYKLPPKELFTNEEKKEIDTQEYQNEIAKQIVSFYKSFDVKLKFLDLLQGGFVSSFRFKIQTGTRISKIHGLEEELAIALDKTKVRFALVDNKATFEVPNKSQNDVTFRKILESKQCQESTATLPIILGETFGNKPIVKDLTKMPHLLIAGSVGSGKTNCVNSIIASLICKMSPENLRFIMIAPKVVELRDYDCLPHMLMPAISNPEKALDALEWLIGEMMRRYEMFKFAKAVNIKKFNEKCLEENRNIDKLPYIICVIDELADLMMFSANEFESSIIRLCQLARGAGIHLIVSTQRPSTNVITGIIKTSLPSRIAFKVSSMIDSRTILDVKGAEKLVGLGDMLFSENDGTDLTRIQSTYIKTEEIEKLIDFINENKTNS